MFLHEMKTVTELREEVAALEGKVGSGESEVERLNEMIKHIAKENGAEREELESLKRVVENESKNSEYLKLRLDQDRKLAVKEKEKLGDRNKELEGVVVQLEEAMLAIRAEHSKLQQQHQLQTAQGIKLNEIVGRLTAEKFELSSHRKSLETSLKDVTEKHEKAHRNASVHKVRSSDASERSEHKRKRLLWGGAVRAQGKEGVGARERRLLAREQRERERGWLSARSPALPVRSARAREGGCRRARLHFLSDPLPQEKEVIGALARSSRTLRVGYWRAPLPLASLPCSTPTQPNSSSLSALRSRSTRRSSSGRPPSSSSPT
jgi:hypothetical protein